MSNTRLVHDNELFTEEKREYEHPLIKRYASKEMSYIWSPRKKFRTWRLLWIALATAEKELGIDISSEQIEEMQREIDNIDWKYAAEKEFEFRHDVMGHVHAYGKVCPKAKPIIHLGATSCFVGDNTDIIQIMDASKLILSKLVSVMKVLTDFAIEHKSLPTLGFTHFQPAQLTTVGKRCSLWIQDFLLDLNMLEDFIEKLPLRGVKGTTGTQATFLQLFENNHSKVIKLDQRVCQLLGFTKSIPVSGQTYTRKIDYQILCILSGIAQSAYKMCGDIRLLANLKEIEEPFSATQIGSSAMAYKRNPMRCERVCSLARYVMNLPSMAAQTHSTQWFERTLDDSAIRRIILPEAFLATDIIITLLNNVSTGLHVWPQVIHSHVMSELPFMATENILMACTKAGGDRQELHELIRLHSMNAGKRVKEEGLPNDLLERVRGDSAFSAVHANLDSLIDPKLFIGRCPEQVEEFLSSCIYPIFEKYHQLLETVSNDNVNV